MTGEAREKLPHALARCFASPALLLTLSAAIFMVGGCKKENEPSRSGGGAPGRLTLTLDWKPEPEFGGFYEAQRSGAFARNGLDVQLKSAAQGTPTWQLVATGKTDFATTAADQVLIARDQGADVVALFAVYQTFPQGIMVHRARGFTKVQDVFTHDGTLSVEKATWLTYLLGKYATAGPPKVKLVGYAGGIGAFLAKPDYSQQCFVTSEPLLAAAEGGDPQTFLIADAGYNPYTTVVICKSDLVRNEPAKARAIVLACREGWRGYLDDPAAANAEMEKLNKDMDAWTFEEAAKAQAPLIETDETRKSSLGTMTAERWKALGQQLVDLTIIHKIPSAEACFVDVDNLPEKRGQ